MTAFIKKINKQNKTVVAKLSSTHKYISQRLISVFYIIERKSFFFFFFFYLLLIFFKFFVKVKIKKKKRKKNI